LWVIVHPHPFKNHHQGPNLYLAKGFFPMDQAIASSFYQAER